jgi:hypothetical protein
MESQLSQDLGNVDGHWAPGYALDAIVAGHDNNAASLYPCNAGFAGGLYPGKFRSDWTGCDFGYANIEHTVSPFSTLTPQWVAASGGTIPAGATPYGNESTGEPLYICRVSYGSWMFTGKIRSAYGGCLFGFRGVETRVTSYDVLVNTSAWAVHTLPVVTQTATAGVPLPYNAIAGAIRADSSLVYPCIGQHAGGWHPGYMQIADNTCTISYWGGQYSITAPYYAVLVPEWNTPGSYVVPLVAGYDASNHAMGICNATWPIGGYGLQVGEYWTSDGTCRFGYGGSEVTVSSGFQVLSVFD